MSADSLIPAPPPVRCRSETCGKVCRNGTTDGYGPKCARKRGLLPPRAPRAARPVRESVDNQPNLFDLIEAEWRLQDGRPSDADSGGTATHSQR